MDVERSDSSTLIPTAHHESLYFPDGNLVIASSLEQGRRTLFRVHTFMVARHSPVFNDMLSLPVDGSGERELYDGVPLVLLPDEVDEIIALLQVFYNPGFPLFKHHDPDFAVVGYKLMKMGRKYQIDSVCLAVKNHLEQEWPRTLLEMTQHLLSRAEVQDSATHNLKDGLEPPMSGSAWRIFPEPASAIRLAVDFDIRSILPAAFYVLSTMDVTCEWPSSERSRSTQWWERPARWNLLTTSERLAYFEGKCKLARTQVDLRSVFGSYSPPEPIACKEPWPYTDEELQELEKQALIDMVYESLGSPCVCTANNFVRDWFQEDDIGCETVRSADPLSLLLSIEKKMPLMKWCNECGPGAKSHVRWKISKLWKEIPSIFGL